MHRVATPIMSAVLTLSSFHRLSAAFPSILCRSLCIPSNFPTLQGFSECWNLSSPSASCQGAGPFLDLSFIFFLSFVLPNDKGIFLVLLGVWSLLLMFNRFSVRITSFVDIFSMYLWGEMNSTSSYSIILTLLKSFSFLYNFCFVSCLTLQNMQLNWVVILVEVYWYVKPVTK